MTVNPYQPQTGGIPLPRQQMPPMLPPDPVQQTQQPNAPSPQMSPEQSIQELQKAVSRSQEILMTATTVFPFTMFPDTITLDREKLTVSHRFFFRVAEVTSIRVEDILNITADVGPFFGSIKISTRFFDEREPHTINYLWRSDALRLKRVVQGYIISMQKGIDCSAFSPSQLRDMLDKLGQAAPNEES